MRNYTINCAARSGLHHGKSVLASLRNPLWLVCLFAVLISACSEGGDPAPTPVITEIDPPLPAKRNLLPDLSTSDHSFDSTHYAGNGVCSACHSDAPESIQSGVDQVMVVNESAGPRNVSIGNAWESSMMANSTRDPYWHAVVAAELHRYENLEEEINDTCTRCHAPMASDMAEKEGLELRLFDKGSVEEGNLVQGIYSMNDSSDLFNHAMDGVSCSLCHQIADDGNLGSDASFTGGFSILLPPADPSDRPAYGQYQQVDVGYMRQQSGYTPQIGTHISTSETCATCHNLTSETVDINGQPLAEPHAFPEQTIYSEWLNSDYNVGGSKEANCQSCHMPRLTQAVPISNVQSYGDRDNFAEHTFLGANTVMQSMMDQFSEQLGIDDGTDNGIDFESSIERNRTFLQTAATVELQNSTISDGTLQFDALITNNTGHKLPSGYHSRRVYLHVLVTDANGQQVFESGRINSNGSITGVSEDVDPASFETHYDVISSPTQVQVYQSIMRNSDGDRTHSLLNGFDYVKDNRLMPSGMNKMSAPENIGVYGGALLDGDFTGGSDTVTFRVPVSNIDAHNVLVELRYQPLSFGHLANLFTLSEELDQVDIFRTMYDLTNLKDEVIASTEATIQ